MHIGSAKSLLRGLSTHEPSPGYLIHTSGTGLLDHTPNGHGKRLFPTNSESSLTALGQTGDKIYSDNDDIDTITSWDMPGNPHREVDNAVMTDGKSLKVPTAIIAPPTIHGVGKGPVKTRSIQIPWLTEAILKHGKAFTVGEGKNVWDGETGTGLAPALC